MIQKVCGRALPLRQLLREAFWSSKMLETCSKEP